MKVSGKVLVFIWTLTVIGLFASIVTAAEEGLVLYFKFDEITQDQVIDDSGNENHGEVAGESDIANGKIGNGVMIEGSKANNVKVEDADSLDLEEVYSLLVWVNFSEITGTRHQFFFDKGADDKTPGGWRVGKVMSGDLILQVFKDGAWKPALSAASPGFVVDQWYHVAVTRDNSGEAKIYLDGKEKVSAKSDDYIFPLNDNALVVWGSDVFGENNMFMGVMDELAIFKDRALSAKEIQSFMENQATSVWPAGKLATVWGSVKEAN